MTAQYICARHSLIHTSTNGESERDRGIEHGTRRACTAYTGSTSEPPIIGLVFEDSSAFWDSSSGIGA